MKIGKSDEYYLFCFTQQYTSETHRTWRETTEGRSHHSKTHCKGKYNWIYRKSNNKNDISHQFQYSYQLCDFHTRSNICRVGHQKLLTINAYGAVRIYENSHQIFFTRHYCTFKNKWVGLSQCIYLYVNHTRNVWITTIGDPWKQLTITPSSQPCMLPGQMHIKIMETCVETFLSHW